MSEARTHPSSAWPPGLERGLRGYWYPICRSEDLGDQPLALTRLCEPLVAWRDGHGRAHVLHDRCPHRGAALSVGRIWGDVIECKYHGLVFDGSGQCQAVPPARASAAAANVSVPAYPTEEAAGAVWAFLGDTEPTPFEPPAWLVEPSMLGWWQAWVFEANWLLVQDNNGDISHVTYAHDPRYRYGDPSAPLRITTRDIPDGVVVELADPPPVADDRPEDERDRFDSFEVHLPGRVELWLRPDAVAWIADHHRGLDASPAAYAGERAYRCVQYMLPIDEHSTLFMNWYGRRCDNDEEARHWTELYAEKVLPSERIIFDQDNELIRSTRSLELARSHEQLFGFDVGTIRIRRLLADAYARQGAR